MEFGRRREMEPVVESVASSSDPATPAHGSRVFAKRLPSTMPHARREAPPPTVRSVYEEHARFVWLTLQRLGIRPTDLEDVAHDVFVVVHRKLHTFDGSSRMTTWLFGICMRLAANYRRGLSRVPSEAAIRARVSDDPRVELPADEMLARREERAAAELVLAELSLEKRATFVMFEIEGLSGQEISELMDIPIGTVYSRLHEARKQVDAIVARTSARRMRAGETK